MQLKDLLAAYRKENKLSQREFARKCGLSHSLIAILENGINKQTGKKPVPDTVTYKKLADGMGMTVAQFFQQIDDDELVNLVPNSSRSLIVPDSDVFRKIIIGMDPDDYRIVMGIFEKTERNMKAKGIW